MRLLQNIYVPTMETVKVAFVMESLLTTQKPVAICGDGACGKTSMIKDFVFNQIFLFT
jgi:GTPase SAR1 family protein